MKKIILSTLTLLLFIHGVMYGYTADTQHQELLQAEFKELIEILENEHPDLYANTSRREFIEQRKELEERISSISSGAFFYELKELLALLHDGHTSVMIGDITEIITPLPFGIISFDEGWFLGVVEADQKDYVGSQVLTINDTPIDEVFEKSKSIISHETEGFAKTQFSNTINFTEALEHLQVIEPNEEVTLTVKLSDNSLKTIPMQPFSMGELDSLQLESIQPKSIAETQYLQSFYSSRDLNEETLFIQYNSCQEDPNFPMSEFANFIEEAIANNTFSAIIIDLRYNIGGNSEVIRPLERVLIEASEDKNISFYTLISSYTFSSGTMFAWETKERLNSTLVGTPTGGALNSFGELGVFQFTALPIMVSYSTKQFEMTPEEPFGTPIYPDVYIPQSIEAYLQGLDLEVEWVLKKHTGRVL